MDKQPGKRVAKTQRRSEGEKIPRFTQSNTLKKQIGIHKAMITYIDSSLKTHFHP